MNLRHSLASPFLGRADSGLPDLDIPEGLDVAPGLFREIGNVFGGWGEEASQRLLAIKAQIRPAFSAQRRDAGLSPSTGHLQVASAQAIVYGFFAREHGWLVKGLEPPGSVHAGHDLKDVVVLRKAPALSEAIAEVQ